MRIEHLREFMELAYCLNYTKAARSLCIAQSTLSKHMAMLEKELEARLFVNEARGVRLTSAGRALLQEAASLVSAHDAAVLKIRSMSKGSLSVAGVYYNARVTAMIDKLSERAFVGAVEYLSFPTKSLLDAVRDGNVDIAIAMFDGEPSIKGCDHCHLFFERMVAVVEKRHMLADRKRMSISEFDGLTEICPTGSHLLFGHDAALSLEERHGVTMAKRGVFLDSILDFPTINLGQSVLFIEESVARALASDERHSIVTIEEEDACFNVCAVWRSDNENPATREFVEALAAIVCDDE